MTKDISAPEKGAVEASVTDPALVKIRDLIYRVSGIFQADNKFYLLADRCQRRMKVIGQESLGDYLGHLTTRPNRAAEMASLLNEITVGESFFFRSQPQIDALTKIVLPKLTAMTSKQSCKKIRVWSAGCSTGEEPYTISILLLEQIAQKYPGWTFEIIATDLNENSVAKSKEGIFSDYAIRNVSAPMLVEYFTKQGSLYKIKDAVRANVKFDRLNLQDQAKILFMKGFDLIFCCNVLIYFDGVSKRRTVEHFYNGLLPGGYFFLGDSESLYGIYDQFRLVHFPGATGYCKPALGKEVGGQHE
jgi:chemotaxis protein methyltransferase CheR